MRFEPVDDGCLWFIRKAQSDSQARHTVQQSRTPIINRGNRGHPSTKWHGKPGPPSFPEPRRKNVEENVDTHYFYTFLSLIGRSGDLGLRKENVDTHQRCKKQWVSTFSCSCCPGHPSAPRVKATCPALFCLLPAYHSRFPLALPIRNTYKWPRAEWFQGAHLICRHGRGRLPFPLGIDADLRIQLQRSAGTRSASLLRSGRSSAGISKRSTSSIIRQYRTGGGMVNRT